MVKINRVYTKTGDGGDTGLVGGRRVGKDSERVQVYGAVDELNSYVGLIRTAASEADARMAASMALIQNELFDIGSILATAPGDEWNGMPHITEAHIARLESWIDESTEKVPELRSFVLPGGTFLNAYLHIARAVCRRVERDLIKLSRTEHVSKEIIVYLNRLSDLLFAFAREAAVIGGKPEYLWQVGTEPQERA